MTDAVTNAEVEDVLSSIRRLVSDDKRTPPEPEGATGPDRLVLTPALRVAEIARNEVADKEASSSKAQEPVDPDDDAQTENIWDDAPQDLSEQDLSVTAGDWHSEADPVQEGLDADAGPLDGDRINAGDADMVDEGPVDAETDVEDMAMEALTEDTAEDNTAEDAPEDAEDADAALLATLMAANAGGPSDEFEDLSFDAQDDENEDEMRFSSLVPDGAAEADDAQDTSLDAAHDEDADYRDADDGDLILDVAREEEEDAPEQIASATPAVASTVETKRHDATQALADLRSKEADAAVRTARVDSLSSKISVLERVIARAGDRWEPDDVGVDDYAGTEPPAMAWEDVSEGDTATPTDDALTTRETPSTTLDAVAREMDLAKDDVADLAEVAIDTAPDDAVSDAMMDAAPETAASAQAAAEAEIAEPEEVESARAEPEMAEPEKVEPATAKSVSEAETVIAASAAASNSSDMLGAEDDLMDEDALRDLVAEIVRQELQGALGERITRNVRKLVRREIHRALAAQELD